MQDLIEGILGSETCDMWPYAVGILCGIHLVILCYRIFAGLAKKRPLWGVFASDLGYTICDLLFYFILGFTFDACFIESGDEAIDFHFVIIPFLITCGDLGVRFFIASLKRRKQGRPIIASPVYLLIDVICYLVLVVYRFFISSLPIRSSAGVVKVFLFLVPIRVICVDLVIRFAVFCYRKTARRNKVGG